MPGKIKENHEKPSARWCPSQELQQAHPKYKSEDLLA
jgi:hypothetical protein